MENIALKYIVGMYAYKVELERFKSEVPSYDLRFRYSNELISIDGETIMIGIKEHKFDNCIFIKFRGGDLGCVTPEDVDEVVIECTNYQESQVEKFKVKDIDNLFDILERELKREDKRSIKVIFNENGRYGLNVEVIPH